MSTRGRSLSSACDTQMVHQLLASRGTTRCDVAVVKVATRSLSALLFNLGVGGGMAAIGNRPILIATALLHPLAAVVVRWFVQEPLRAASRTPSPVEDRVG